MDRVWKEPEENATQLDRKPNILPVIGVISKKFDEEDNHFGIDFAATLHEPVFSTASGKVLFVGTNEDLGKTVEIDHGNGLITRYGHLSSYYVKKGNVVRKGETIGAVGMSGKTTGPHLHYEIKLNGKSVNPENYFTE